MKFRPAFVSVPLGLAMATAGVYLSQAGKVAIPDAEPAHPVTAEMLAKADRSHLRPAPKFRLEDPVSGQTFDAETKFAERPTVVFFIKDGCPCSIEAQPVFDDLAAAYAGRAQFVGIIDGDAEVARRFAETHGARFPVLFDPDLRTMEAYEAPRSVYFALVNLDGRIERLWPGYDKMAIADLNDRLTQLVGGWPARVDTTRVPTKPTSGCAYESD